MKTNAPLGMLSTLVAALAPNVEAQDDVWVFFKDKPAISQREIAANFSERAVARRQRARVSWDFFDAPVNPAYLETLQATGVAVKYASRWLNAAACSMNENQRRVVENMQFVTGVRPCARMRHARHCTADFAQATLSHPVYGNGFQQVRMLGVDTLHALGYNGKGVVVAVFDDGFLNADLVSAFADMRAEGRLLGVYDFVENDSSVFHVGAHGTAVLSVLAGYLPGSLVGPAHGASFYLFRTENGFSETIAEEYHWVAAAEEADRLGADVCQTSLGYLTFDGGVGDHSYPDLDGNTTVITLAADLAASRGMVVVNSAGNEGNNAWGYIIAPADGDSVLAVGSVNAARVRSAFSSRGPTYDGRIKPDVMAMGQSTVFQSAFGNIVSGSGTSFSAPLVSGLVACLLQAAPYAAGYAVHQAVVRSADRFLQPDNEYGYGIPNGFEALKIVSALNPEPVWPGDADLDGRVQTGDVYLTASAYGRTGPARSVAGALWQPYPAPEGWNTVSHVRGRVVNDRYLDANGDGSVNLFDLALVVSRQGFVR